MQTILGKTKKVGKATLSLVLVAILLTLAAVFAPAEYGGETEGAPSASTSTLAPDFGKAL